ncbi:MAG: hypothetical protein HZA16_08690 [Nitrospirae bacterium]|nr:hypothetical protein [Nitrospirota bacterium]
MKHFNLLCLQICVCIVILLTAAACSRNEQEPKTKLSSTGNEVVGETALLSTIATDENPSRPNAFLGHSAETSVQGRPEYFHIVFNEKGRGVAYIAERSGKSYVSFNGRPGKSYQGIGAMSVSPDGMRIAYGAQAGEKWRMVVDGSEGTFFDEVGEPLFSDDSRHIAYQARSGDKWRMVLDGKMSAECASFYGRPYFSNDSNEILYVENTEEGGKVRLIVSDLLFKDQQVKTLRAGLVAVNRDKSRIAVSFERNGKQGVMEFSFAETEKVKEGRQYDAVLDLAFASDGVSTVYIALGGGKRLIVINDREEPLPDGETTGQPVVSRDNNTAGIIMSSGDGFFLHEAFVKDGAKKKKYEEAADLVYGRDGGMHAYTARRGDKWFVVVNGKEGPEFDRVVTPALSTDGKYLVYRARKDGGRFVVVADPDGRTLNRHPAYEQVFQPVFTADGKSIAYGVKDGNKLIWKVEKLP